MIVNDNYNVKFISVARMKKLAKDLPDDLMLSPNQMGNISIYRREGDDLTPLGYIDFFGEGELQGGNDR